MSEMPQMPQMSSAAGAEAVADVAAAPPLAIPEPASEPRQGDTDPPAPGDLPKARVPSHRSIPKWEAEARDRIRSAIRRFAKPLAELVERDANEGDTRLLVTDMLCVALGYDKYEDLTTEYQVKGEFADYGIRIDRQLIAFIEVKRVAQKLGHKHLRQVQMYAVNEGLEWIVLTNGQTWQAYHLTGGLPVIVDLALEVNLLDPNVSSAKKADALFYLSKDAMRRRLIDDLWRHKAATSPQSLARILLTPAVVDAVRKQLRRQTELNADVDELTTLLHDTVIRPDCFAKRAY